MSYRTEKSIVKADVRERPIRKSVHLPAKVIVGVKNYPGFLINISAKGVGMFVINTTFPECTINCTKGTVLKLVVESTFGVFVTLQCRIKWLRIKKCSSKEVTTSMGMGVIDPPPSFIKLFENLLQ